jgi:endonuclease-3 related protein
MANNRYSNAHTGVDEDVAFARRIADIYKLLFKSYGPQHWWPADTPFEVIIGAILTQSAAWANVEQAIANLRREDALNPAAIRALPVERLAQLIYPSGYYNAKAGKLRAFVDHLGERYADSLDGLFALDTQSLRAELLAIHGIGPETADSIILYAARKPIFVVDAYTVRVMARLGLADNGIDYHSLQALFMSGLPHDEGLFNEYHALLVRHGKNVCRKSPQCDGCCLARVCASPRA